jgi:N-acetylglucosamine-6-phosphate deacetylase
LENTTNILIKNLPVYTDERVIKKGFVWIEGEKITKIGHVDDLQIEVDAEIITFDESHKLVPGMIDLHIHGVAGADTMDATPEALQTIARTLPREGTTSFLATTMTTSIEGIEKAIMNVTDSFDVLNNEGNAEILGIHLEGPFLSPLRAGAQHPENIIEPNVELFKRWQSLANNHIKLVTLAPERNGGMELTSYLKEERVIASIGHSDAVYEEVVKAIEAGVTHATHLYNGMRGIHHREPGVVGSVFLHDEIKAEIIVDGIHNDPKMVKLAYKNKGNEGIILVTDAMRAKCLGAGVYDLGGQEATVDEEKATLQNGSLAGSILKMNDARKKMIQFTNCSIEDTIQMASVNPAKQLNYFDRKGSIAVGKDADLVVLDENNDVEMTFCRGNLVFSR